MVLALLASASAHASAQSLTASVQNDVVRVRAVGFEFIRGGTVARLKDGQTVRVELLLSLLPKPGAEAVAASRQTFVLSYDLWEERYAVTPAGTPSRASSHLTASGAEAWCLEQLTIPVSGLEPPIRSQFWVRLGYRILDSAPAAADDSGFTLRGLIDALSPRRRADELTRSIEAGPFRLRE